MATATLEPAIPEHLQVQRTCPARMPPGHVPVFPSYCARFPATVDSVVMATIGSQHSHEKVARESGALQKILSFVKADNDDRPRHHDIAAVIDAIGSYNEVVIAYWDDAAKYEAWKNSSGFDSWWKSLDPKTETHGWFQEVFTPSIDRLESLYSDLPPGVYPAAHGAMSTHLSGTIQEHVYWGSMRDRLPISQTDELVGEDTTGPDQPNDTIKARIKVPGKQNLCVIRSGQDWSKTNSEERKLYLESMHPVLTEGMKFLRDQGAEVGCYSCRLMNVLDSESFSSDTDQTFGLAFFDDISSLERWSREHQTHLNIFGGFLQYVKKLDNQVTFHAYHEVMVLKPEQQFFEYVGCHPGTGILGGLKERS